MLDKSLGIRNEMPIREYVDGRGYGAEPRAIWGGTEEGKKNAKNIAKKTLGGSGLDAQPGRSGKNKNISARAKMGASNYKRGRKKSVIGAVHGDQKKRCKTKSGIEKSQNPQNRRRIHRRRGDLTTTSEEKRGRIQEVKRRGSRRRGDVTHRYHQVAAERACRRGESTVPYTEPRQKERAGARMACKRGGKKTIRARNHPRGTKREEEGHPYRNERSSTSVEGVTNLYR